MIINKEPLSMAESKYFLSKQNEKEAELNSFIEKFMKLNPKEAKEMNKKLSSLDLMKMKVEHITKIIDILPEDAEDLNKIFVDVSLDEDETKKILEIVKGFK